MEGTQKQPDSSAAPRESEKGRSLAQLAAQYDFTKDLQAGNFVDVKDSTGSWCVAQVAKWSPENIHIHYEGWSDKFDEVPACQDSD